MSERLQQYTLTFRVADKRKGCEIAARLKSRAAEMGGFVAMEFSPPLLGGDAEPPDLPESPFLHQLPGEHERDFNVRKASFEAMRTEARKSATPVGESPLAKFGRVFGG